MQEMITAQKEKYKKNAQERYEKNKAEGKCVRCYAPAVPGKTVCQPCLDRGKITARKYADIYRLNNRKKTEADIFNGTLKKCPSCNDTLPREKQYWGSNPSYLDGVSSWCVDCRALDTGRAFAKKRNEPYNPDGYTTQVLREMRKLGCYFAAFGGCYGELCCEHNHTTGRIRGFVCDHHNMTLLKAFDTLLKGKTRRETGEILIQLFPKIIEYLYNPPGRQLGEKTITVSLPIVSNTLAL